MTMRSAIASVKAHAENERVQRVVESEAAKEYHKEFACLNEI